MKIVFIITDYGSFNNFLGDLALALIEQSTSVHVICSSTKVINVEDKYEYTTKGITFSFIEFPRGFNVFKHIETSRKIKIILDKIKPSFVYIHFTTGIFSTTFTGRLDYPTAGMFHGLGYPVVDGLFKSWLYKFIESRCIHRIDDIWVLNTSDKIILECDFPSREIKLLPTKGLGCDLEKFNPATFHSKLKEQIREELNISKSDFVITFTGRFVYFKGFDKVVRSMLYLLNMEKKINIKLLLIGGEDSVHSTGLSEIETEMMNECSNIVKVGFRSDVERFLSISDLFVFPSEKEGMPVCIIESLAMGVPVITANTRGCKDLIKHYYNGLILKDNTPMEIVDMISMLMNDNKLYDTMKINILNDRSSMSRQNFINHQLKYITNQEIIRGSNLVGKYNL